jgi:acyl-CoA thioesterase-1
VPAYVFRHAPALRGLAATVYTLVGGVRSAVAATGTLANDGTLALTLPVGDYLAVVRGPAGTETGAREERGSADPDSLVRLDDLTGGFARSGAMRAIAIGDSTTMGDSVHPMGWVYNTGPSAGLLADGTYPPVGPLEYRHGPRSWFEHACLQSMGKLLPIFNAGQGSDTSDGMVKRFAADVLAKAPDVVFIGDGHNDGSMTEAQSRANITSMIDQAQGAGIRVVLVTAFPSDDSTSIRMRRHNAWLKKLARSRGILLADKYAAVVDPADGTYLASMTVDGTHTSYAGAQAAGARVLSDIAGILAGGPDWLPTDNVQDTNLLGNGLFVNNITGASGTIYTNGAGTTAFETDATKFLGRAAVCTLTAAGGLQADVNMAARGIAVGDRLKWAGLARVRNAVAGNLKWNLEISCPGVGNPTVRPVDTTASGMDMTR